MRYLTPRPRRQYQIMFSLLANGSATGKNQRCELKKKNLRSHIKLQLTLSVWLFLGSSSDHPPSIPCAQSRAPGQSWYPGTATPEYLDGSLVGDFGFDPLNLGEEPYKLKVRHFTLQTKDEISTDFPHTSVPSVVRPGRASARTLGNARRGGNPF